ncbi:MAG TPA: MarR family transcriptional regulator [Alphaproteobacteria bacterium]|nr:MarR family transcriptional regulator [Alphaproteobacteria bacterium]
MADKEPTGVDCATAATPEERIDRLIEVLEEFRRLDPDMPIQYALSFLTLARHEGLSIRELAERLDIAQSSASRNVAALGEWHSFRKPGHDLVQAKEDPRERRRKIVTVTERGRDLLARLDALLCGERPRGTMTVARLAPGEAARGNLAKPKRGVS